MSETNGLLTLTDYSKKYSVSISTLRRRIKGQAADFHLIDGKYYLVDLPLDNHVQSASEKKWIAPPHQFGIQNSSSEVTTSTPVSNQHQSDSTESPVLSAASRLLDELKSAYLKIADEKTEQITLLKEEVSDLKTLVRVLEAENIRLRKLNTADSFFESLDKHAPQGTADV